MANQRTSEPGADAANPYAAPTSEMGERWGTGDPELEAIRRANSKDESYVKALAIINFVYVFLFGPETGYLIWILISHVTGRLHAPWITRPGWLIMFFLASCCPIAAFGAACGFLRRKRGALWFELSLAVCLFGRFALDPLIGSKTPSVLEFIGTGVWVVGLAAPKLNAWDLWGSAVLDAEYSAVVAATRHIRVRPKLPVKLKLITIALFLVFVGLAAFSARP